MIINVKEIQDLLNSDVTGYAIHVETGISQGNISGLRNGTRKLENTNLKTLTKFQKFINDRKNDKTNK